MQNHVEAILRTLWTYADRHHVGELDGGKREGRPPVFAPNFASMNVLTPSCRTTAADIRSAIPMSHRHRWFHSMRSSQALTQSVFAAIRALGRLHLLEGVPAECGRVAFFDDQERWRMCFEHELEGLNEPRPTSIDLLLRRPGQQVAIECKFLEDEFGTCSRTDKRYSPEKHCDGSYKFQNGRSHRCALSEVGIRYWELLPHVFNWSADRDHEPCPFGATYQLARNALAASMTTNRSFKPDGNHVLVLYDARNPAFRAGGKAYSQWQLVLGAQSPPGLFRRLSWQRLLTSLADGPELAYLIDGLGEKYGLEPD